MLYQLSYFRNLICFCFLTISKNNRYRSVLRVQRYCFFLNHQIYFEKKSLFSAFFLIFAHFWPKMCLSEGKNGDFLCKKSRWASECFFYFFATSGRRWTYLPLRHALKDGRLVVRDEISIESHGVAGKVWGNGGTGLIGACREGEAYDG